MLKPPSSVILEAFNNTFKDFLKELSIVFPENTDIKRYKNAFNLLTNMTPKLTIVTWQEYVNDKYYDEIMSSPIEAFIDRDYSEDLKHIGDASKTMEAIKFINNIREPLRDLEETNQATSLAYVRNLCKLSAAYSNN
jgi:hypothetical protein